MGSDEEYDFSGGVSLREDGVQPGVPHTFTANESVLSLSSGQQYCYTASLHGRSAVVSVHLKPNLIYLSISFHSSFYKPESQSQKCWWYYTSNGAGFVMLSLRSCSVRITQRE